MSTRKQPRVMLLAVMASSCAQVVCGPGTVQMQAPDGALRCVPTEATAPQIQCDADAGAAIVAGHCVSAISCGANTRLDPTSHACVSTGVSKPSCPAPAPGKVCVQGTIRRLADGMPITTEQVKVGAYSPLALLGDPTTATPAVPPEDPVPGDTYVLADIDPTAVGGKLALLVTDPTGAAALYQPAATSAGANGISAGQVYTIDVYVIPRSLVASWAQQAGGGIDYATSGAYVARFFADKLTNPTVLTATETEPVAGVTLIGSSGTPPATYYFGADLMTLDKTLTATGAVGTAITPGTGNASVYNGMGGVDPMTRMAISWGSGHLGAAAHGIILVDRFHAM